MTGRDEFEEAETKQKGLRHEARGAEVSETVDRSGELRPRRTLDDERVG